jgi:hypothetical protein
MSKKMVLLVYCIVILVCSPIWSQESPGEKKFEELQKNYQILLEKTKEYDKKLSDHQNLKQQVKDLQEEVKLLRERVSSNQWC